MTRPEEEDDCEHGEFMDECPLCITEIMSKKLEATQKDLEVERVKVGVLRKALEAISIATTSGRDATVYDSPQIARVALAATEPK